MHRQIIVYLCCVKPMTLNELHRHSLDLLKDIDAFCRPRGIRYSLAFGTLLGAVRHKGFIPWDDDIDLVMPREDYIRFRKEYVSDRFEFIDRESTPECYIGFGRVVDTKETCLVGVQPWHSNKINSGTWVDIFPMDYVPDDHDEYMSLYRCMNFLLRLSRKVRRFTAHGHPALPLSKRFKLFVRKIGHGTYKKLDPSEVALDYVRTLRLATSAKTSHLGSLSCADTPSFYFESSVFDEYVDLPFEGGMFLAPAKYDLVLRTIFGDDYMQLPPEKDRKTDLYKLGNVYYL